jgi:hypothetical protein
MQWANLRGTMTPMDDIAEQESLIETEPYPDWADDDEQRRAFVLEAVGVAASELDAHTLGQLVVDLAEMLRTGTSPPTKTKRLRPVT